VDSLIQKWLKQPKGVFVGHDMQKLTLDVLASCIFGMEFDTLNGNIAEPLMGYNYSIERIFNPLRFLFPWVNNLPLDINQKLTHNMNLFDKYCWEIMGESKKRVEDRKKDNITLSEKEVGNLSLIELMYENGITEEVIRDNVSLFFLAGHETTATILSWVCSVLATQPEVFEKARKEVLEKVPDDEFTYDALKDLTYIDALIKETLRLHPPVTLIANRYVTKDTVIGNIRVPAETSIGIDMISMSYDPKIWGDPLVFRPERWFSDNITKEQRMAWIPFSSGPRVCIGMNFSLLEQKIFLVQLCKKVKDIQLSPNSVIKYKVPTFTNSLDTEVFSLDFVLAN